MKTPRLFLVSFLVMALSTLTGWRSHHHKKHKTEQPSVEQENSEPKKLDLSLPLKIEDKPNNHMTQAKTNTQIEKPKKIERAVELEPQSIMSAEPEADKIKSFDGAGFSINIKR